MPFGFISRLRIREVILAALRHFSSASRETASLAECCGAHDPAIASVSTRIVQSLLGWFVSPAVVTTVSLCNHSSCMLALERIPDICMDVYMFSRQTDEIALAKRSSIPCT